MPTTTSCHFCGKVIIERAFFLDLDADEIRSLPLVEIENLSENTDLFCTEKCCEEHEDL